MFTAPPGSPPVLQVFVDRVNKHVFTPVFRYPAQFQGKKRAEKRLAKKLKANKKIPPAYKFTRQQRRAAERTGIKEVTPTPAEQARLNMAARG